MALIKCTECGNQISEFSDKCPQCGCPIEVIKKDSRINNIDSSTKVGCAEAKKQLCNKKIIIGISTIIVIIILAIIIPWSIKKSSSKSNIADVTIDKVTTELSIAVKKYDELNNFCEGLAIVRKDGKYGYIDKLGKEVIPCKYEEAEDFEFGIAVVTLNEKEGAIDIHNKTIIPFIYDWISFSKDSIAVARKDGKYGMINLWGKTLVPFEYDYCNDYSEGLAAVVKNNKLGFVNRQGEVTIPLEYEYHDNYYCRNTKFKQGLAAVIKDGLWGYINKNGDVVIPFQLGLIGAPFYKSGVSIIENTDGMWIRQNGHFKQNDHKLAFIDYNGQRISDWITVGGAWYYGYWEDGYISYAIAGNHSPYYWGLLGCDGHIWLNPNLFNEIDYRGDDIVVVGKETASGSRWGIYNIVSQQLCVPIMYDYIGYVSEGVVSAKKDSKTGFINFQNETIIPFHYDDAGWFSEGFAVVQRFGKYGYVDRYGNDTFQ